MTYRLEEKMYFHVFIFKCGRHSFKKKKENIINIKLYIVFPQCFRTIRGTGVISLPKDCKNFKTECQQHDDNVKKNWPIEAYMLVVGHSLQEVFWPILMQYGGFLVN